MCPGSARRHDHASKSVLFDLLLNAPLSILGASIEILLSVHHVREGFCILGHSGDIHDPADIDTTMANKYANFGANPADVLFFWIGLCPRQFTAAGFQYCTCGRSGSACLSHSFRDILRPLHRSASKHPRPCRGERIQRPCLGKAVYIKADSKGFRKVPCITRRP